MKLTRLEASSIRGIPSHWEAIPIGDRGLVVYGHNGSGKSSLVDAVELAITGSSTLFSRDRAGVNWSKAAPHILGGTPTAVVACSTEGRETTVSCGELQRAAPADAAVSDWIRRARESRFVLRRRVLLNFIESNPADRYAALEPFLNLDGFYVVEDQLGDTARELREQASALDITLLRHRAKMQAIFGITDADELNRETLLTKLNSALALLDLRRCTTDSDLAERRDEVAKLLGGTSVTERVKSLAAAQLAIERLHPSDLVTKTADELRHSLLVVEAIDASAGEARSLELLATAAELVEAEHPRLCPLCEQPVAPDSLLARLKERLEDHRRLAEAKKAIRENLRAAASALKDMDSTFEALSNIWEPATGTELPNSYRDALAALERGMTAFASETVASSDVSELLESLDSLPSDHGALLKVIKLGLASEETGDNRRSMMGAGDMLACFTDECPTWFADSNRRAELLRRQATTNRLLEHCESARKSAVRDTLRAVSDIADRVFAQIHPDEAVGGPRLGVREATRGSVTLEAEFEGSRENPLLHFSESHLDTLGLSLFLAMRRYEADTSPSFRLLVLDDILHSIDADHRARVVEMIRNEFGDHQLIVTTHDLDLYKRMRESLDSSATCIRIVNWDLDHGPVLATGTSTDLDLIADRKLVKNTCQEHLSAAAGRMFERICWQLCERLEVPVPLKTNGLYTIGSMWPPLMKRLRKKVIGFKDTHPGLLDAVDNSRWVRNKCGAHDIESAISVTPAEARGFAESVYSLYEATHCKSCGSYIRKLAASEYRCRCASGGIAFGKPVA